MSTPDNYSTLNDTESTVLRLVSDGLQKATEEATSKHGEELLKLILPAVAGSLAGPLARVRQPLWQRLSETCSRRPLLPTANSTSY